MNIYCIMYCRVRCTIYMVSLGHQKLQITSYRRDLIEFIAAADQVYNTIKVGQQTSLK